MKGLIEQLSLEFLFPTSSEAFTCLQAEPSVWGDRRGCNKDKSVKLNCISRKICRGSAQVKH